MARRCNKEIISVALDPKVVEFIYDQAEADGRSISNYINNIFKDIMETINLDDFDESEDNPATRLINRLFEGK